MTDDRLTSGPWQPRSSIHRGYAIETRVSFDGRYWHAVFLFRGPLDTQWIHHSCQSRHETEEAAHGTALQTARLAINFQINRLA